ncbi:MAG: site-specific integrase [Pseudolabrys sp.]|nr:site-specific integrase [Pseudolabrys sp.]
MKNKRPIAELPYGAAVYRSRNGVGQQFWRVRLGKKFTGGKAQQKEFSDLSEARLWIGKQNAQRIATGTSTFQLTPAQIGEAADAYKRLNGTSLTVAVSYYLGHARPAGGKRTLAEVAKEFLKTRAVIGVRPRTFIHYESSFRVLGEEFGDRPISSITRAELEDYFAESDWLPRTRKNYMVTLSTLFTFAQDRDYCPANPVAKIARPILDDRPVGILKVGAVLALLGAASASAPAMVPALTIGLFAGLRRSELCALDWSEINLAAGTIEVTGAKAKTRQRRIVPVGSSLMTWLAPCRTDPGPVTARDDMFGEHLRELVEKAGITDYPHNGIRHSFGSYHYELHRNENLTASEMGNSPAVIFGHYRNLVSPADAKLYFSITPGNLERLIKQGKEPVQGVAV